MSSCKTSVTHLKVKFYRVFICIYSRFKAANSEMITVQLLKAYCLLETCMEIFPRFSRGFPREIPRLREQNVRGYPREEKLILREPAGEGNVVENFPR